MRVIFIEFLFCIFGCVVAFKSSRNPIAQLQSYDCDPCVELPQHEAIRLPQAHSPCLRAGQPIFEWPKAETSTSKCLTLSEIVSESVSFDAESRLVFVKHPHCFYRGNELRINYRSLCGKEWRIRSIRIVHEVNLN